METELIYRRVGNYSTTQATHEEQCKICNSANSGEMLVQRLSDNDWLCVECLLIKYESKQPINIIFDGAPNNDPPRFVEVETDDGASIKIGEWIQRGNYWALRITELPQEPA